MRRIIAKPIVLPLALIFLGLKGAIDTTPGLKEIYRTSKSSQHLAEEEKEKQKMALGPGNRFRNIFGLINYLEKNEGIPINNIQELKKRVFEILREKDVNLEETRNYATFHETQLILKDTFLKIYNPSFKVNDLRESEAKALEFFKELGLNVPCWYYHGKIKEHYDIMIMERIEGEPLDKKIEILDYRSKKNLLKKVLNKAIKIGIEGFVNDLPTSYGELTAEKISEWLNKGVIDKLKTKESESLLEKIKDNYHEINKLLLNSSFLYNKDIPTKNWLIGKDDKIYSIDFENTYFGPIQLDIVTLLEGRNGFELEDQELIQILKYTCKKINDYLTKKHEYLSQFSEEDFIKTYFAASIHRNLSMAGTNKERENEWQMNKHLEKAKYSLTQLQKFVDSKGRKELQNLKRIIHKFQANHV